MRPAKGIQDLQCTLTAPREPLGTFVLSDLTETRNRNIDQTLSSQIRAQVRYLGRYLPVKKAFSLGSQTGLLREKADNCYTV